MAVYTDRHLTEICSNNYYGHSSNYCNRALCRGDKMRSENYRKYDHMNDVKSTLKNKLVNQMEAESQVLRNKNKPDSKKRLTSECFVCKQSIIVENREDAVEYDDNNINVHADCFECTICGAKLFDGQSSHDNNENHGSAPHLLMDGRFYCKMHGVQRQKILLDSDNMPTQMSADQVIQLKNAPMTNAIQNFNTQSCAKSSDVKNSMNTVNAFLRQNTTDNADNALRANMIMASENTPKANEFSRRIVKQPAPQFGEDLPRKYKDFVQNAPVNPQQKAKSIRETLQNSRFIQDLKRNIADRTQKIDKNNATSNTKYDNQATLDYKVDDNKIHEKPTRNSESDELSQQQVLLTKTSNAETTDLNSSIKSSSLIDEFSRTRTNAEMMAAMPSCVRCRQTIRGAHVLANNKTYCPHHFVCANSACNCRLLDCGFFEGKNGRNYCKKCYDMLIAPTCNRCHLPITTDFLKALQKSWHPDCFVCTHCRKPFGENLSFFVENNLPYCEQDWNELFTNKCAKCSRPIKTGECFVEALNSSFHAQCFQCETCHMCLEGETFYARDGKPYCALHRK